ncbi:endonuclease/exonuclease/phosphatase family protein [Sulfitobacter sp. JB4-11]|uniref:endonuclease/exonuclease/phosphatase family protein n=1 Tax=Sulfitobacter rhodophyticola TaxID=3238304 RepID=UPI003513BCAE
MPAFSETLRIATFNTELGRKGPGILLRDILKGDDPQITAVIDTLVQADVDTVALQGFDYDLEGRALQAFQQALSAAGLVYPYRFAAPPNAGLATGIDMDGDGRKGGAGDAQGYGRFYGAGSMAILSRVPILTEDIRDYSAFLWRDLPDALLPQTAAGPFPSPEAIAIQRLSSHGHWLVPLNHPTLGRVTLMTFHASPPVFDGDEDRNGKRNHDEVAFWVHLLEGRLGQMPESPFILAGDANLDPEKGDGRGIAMRNLLNHPAFQDPLPDQPTVTWSQTGPMRVDYVLPSSDLTVTGADVMSVNPAASRHSLVWVDLTR